MIEKKWYPVVYMFVLTAVFSSLVIGFTQSTIKRVEANEKLIFEEAVLATLGLYNPNLSGLEQHKIFVEKIKEPSAQTGGAFTLVEGDRIVAYALPVEGQGFWATIRAVVGIDADKKTIKGFAVYQQNETPGLGAEIAKPEFRNQFKGKIISNEAKPLNINRPGTPLDESSVHAITGATQTSVRLEKLINDGLKNWKEKMSMEAN
jgi:Na+-transporting NADH:ubiquinone oxidoreductase subunit C